jgi:hypothetical protein
MHAEKDERRGYDWAHIQLQGYLLKVFEVCSRLQSAGAAMQPFRGARPLLQGDAASCGSGLAEASEAAKGPQTPTAQFNQLNAGPWGTIRVGLMWLCE